MTNEVLVAVPLLSYGRDAWNVSQIAEQLVAHGWQVCSAIMRGGLVSLSCWSARCLGLYRGLWGATVVTHGADHAARDACARI